MVKTTPKEKNLNFQGRNYAKRETFKFTGEKLRQKSKFQILRTKNIPKTENLNLHG